MPAKGTHAPLSMDSVLSTEELDAANGDVAKALTTKRAAAQKHLEETGSLPENWPLGLAVFDNYRNRNKKYKSVETYMEKAREYWLRMQKQGEIPTLSGLTLHMGFARPSGHANFVLRQPEFRDAHATLMTLLQLPLEYALGLQGVNTKGIEFRLKNIPEGWEPTDPVDAPTRYAWKDRRQAEVVGVNGAALGITTVDKSPETIYQEMQQKGRRLEESGGEAGDG